MTIFIYLFIAFIAGLFIANQTPINTDLGRIVRSPFLAAAISFLVGTIFLGLVTLISGGQLFPNLVFVSHEPAWIWLGGLLGAIYLTTNVLLFPRLGALQTVILPILGQILMGVIIDSFGLFCSPQISLTLLRGIGIIIMIVGVLVAVILPNLTKKSKSNQSKSETKKNLLPWRLWAVVVGSFGAMQEAVNGHLGVELHAPAQASFISFFVGAIIICIVALVVEKRLPSRQQLRTTKPWNWFGGILGGLFVLITVLAVPQLGAGLTIMLGLIGQIIGSILVQQFGLWRSLRYPVRPLQIIGVLVMLVGVIFIKIL